MNVHLVDKEITLRSGTLVDVFIIDTLSSTRNKAGARDPEISSTKKGNARSFGSEEDQQTFRWTVCPTNAHVGVVADSGTVHSLKVTTAKIHYSRIWDELLYGEETSIWADKGYVSAEREAALTDEGKG